MEVQSTCRPKKNINAKNGSNDRPRLINADMTAEIGKIKVGTFIDFKIPELLTTELSN